LSFHQNCFWFGNNSRFSKFRPRFCMEKSLDREFRGIRLKIIRKLFIYDQNANSLAFPWFWAAFREIRDRVIFPYKIADEISKIANYFQTKNNFDENSTWCTLKYSNYEIQNKKLKSLLKIKKLGSFFDFHTKRPKLPIRGMQLLPVILGFGGWNFAGDIIMNHINDFLLLELDLTLPKHPNIYSPTLSSNKICR
jgi:hypothetical protein